MSDDDPHELTQTLLPWYVNRTLQPDEVATVEAHLAECGECKADLQLEQAFGREVAQLSSETDVAWSKFRDRLQRQPRAPRTNVIPRLWSILQFPVELRWAMAGQVATLLVVFGLVAFSTTPKPSMYRTLGSATVHPRGDILAMFKPTISEQSLRSAILRSHARIVDGPTTGDAYALQTPIGQRAKALASLRADPGVVLAEPIDAPP